MRSDRSRRIRHSLAGHPSRITCSDGGPAMRSVSSSAHASASLRRTGRLCWSSRKCDSACTDDAAETHCESRPEVFAPIAARLVRTAEEVSVAIVGETDLATSAAAWAATEQAMALGPRLILDLGATEHRPSPASRAKMRRGPAAGVFQGVLAGAMRCIVSIPASRTTGTLNRPASMSVGNPVKRPGSGDCSFP
jgi:hypothetical protein